ncbi:low temperature requirement protein A [Millisia brevis]|uniref:low temperature requirement protein A n=1 Tax=Millisia brevis TaxID=264148 RepID=UPI000A54E0BD|nr:low temperature requirement protein A [Millisia brevis]
MSGTTAGRRFGLPAMLPRDPAEPHRAASNLELLFDLVFVVAVSISSVTLHHLEAEGRLAEGVLGYGIVFAAIWWAWMTFTWFGTSFDTDDWLYRVTTFVQMAGALVIAAGAPAAMEHGDLTRVVIGYLIMRLAALPQWARVAATNPGYRRTAVRYIIGITVAQTLWLIALVTVEATGRLWIFLPIIAIELAVPAFAERARATPLHPHHIAERFGLFTLILLGESILASANAIIEALDSGEHVPNLLALAVCGLIIVTTMWWTYFARPMSSRIGRGLGPAMVFGYFHYVIFAAAGAFSAGIEVAVGSFAEHGSLGVVAARATLTVPVACFFLGVWWLALRPTLPTAASAAVVTLAAVMAASALLPGAAYVVATCGVGVVLLLEATRRRAPSTSTARTEGTAAVPG